MDSGLSTVAALEERFELRNSNDSPTANFGGDQLFFPDQTENGSSAKTQCLGCVLHAKRQMKVFVRLRSGNKTKAIRQGLAHPIPFITAIGRSAAAVHPRYAGPRLGWGDACR